MNRRSPLPPLLRGGCKDSSRSALPPLIWVGLVVLALLMMGCGDPPQAPTEQRGNVIVQGTLPDGNLADSMQITLDDVDLGYHLNPDTLMNLWAGTHRVSVKTYQNYQGDTLEYLNIPHMVIVGSTLTSVDVCSLTADIPSAPYVGFMAPNFSTYDLDSNLVCLDSLAGKVALLYFWSFT
jgi:hypothetical protein